MIIIMMICFYVKFYWWGEVSLCWHEICSFGNLVHNNLVLLGWLANVFAYSLAKQGVDRSFPSIVSSLKCFFFSFYCYLFEMFWVIGIMLLYTIRSVLQRWFFLMYLLCILKSFVTDNKKKTRRKKKSSSKH